MALARDLPFFLGVDHQDAHARVLACDVGVARVMFIFICIKLHARERELTAEMFANRRTIFANAAREYQRVDSAQHCQHAAGLARQPVHIDIEGQSGPSVTGGPRGQNFPHVAGVAGDTRQTRAAIQNLIELVGRVPAVSQKVD